MVAEESPKLGSHCESKHFMGGIYFLRGSWHLVGRSQELLLRNVFNNLRMGRGGQEPTGLKEQGQSFNWFQRETFTSKVGRQTRAECAKAGQKIVP